MHNQQKPRKVRWKAARLAQALSTPPNPWRGLYAIYPFAVGGDEPVLPPLRPEHTLSLVEINLGMFQEDLISETALRQVNRILAYFEDNRKGMILRFLYDWEGNGLQSEPREITVVLEHMRQLSPMFTRYARSIFTLQGLFVGSWGEMHTSRHLGANSLVNLIQTLDESAQGALLMAVRCPNQWREIMQTFDPPATDRMFDGRLHSRVGLFNDGILASDTDFGTYGVASRARSSYYGDKFSREEEMAFQNRLCLGVPNGGELVKGEGKFTLAETYRAFKLMHLTYLNADFDAQAIDSLRAQPNIARASAWRDTDAYTYLTAHLGYRYCVHKAAVRPAPGGVTVRLMLENTGFANCCFPLEATVYLRTPQGQTLAAVSIPEDTRRWQPGDQHWLTAVFDSLPPQRGEYQLEFGLHDPRSGRPVYLGTSRHGEPVGETLPLGTLQVRG